MCLWVFYGNYISNGIFADDVAATASTPKGALSKINDDFEFAQSGRGSQVNLYYGSGARLTVVFCNIEQFGICFALGQIIFFISGYATNSEVFGKNGTAFPAAINDAIVFLVRVFSVKESNMAVLFSKIGFF